MAANVCLGKGPTGQSSAGQRDLPSTVGTVHGVSQRLGKAPGCGRRPVSMADDFGKSMT